MRWRLADELVFLERYEITVAMAPGSASSPAGSAGGAQGNGVKGAQPAQSQNGHGWADLLNIESDSLIQEIGWDEDCDNSISEALEDAIGDALLDIDTDEVVDVVLLWWRDEDGDLVDGLVDATRSLGEDGRIWLMTPAKLDAGRVEPGVIAESAQLAGLVQTKSERLGDWQGACLVSSGTKR